MYSNGTLSPAAKRFNCADKVFIREYTDTHKKNPLKIVNVVDSARNLSISNFTLVPSF